MRWLFGAFLVSCASRGACRAPAANDGRHFYPRAFVDVSASDRTCGVRVDGTVACWGDGGMGLKPVEASATRGRFVRVRQHGACIYAQRDDFELEAIGDCAPPPAGKQIAFDVFARACAIGDDELLRCWDVRSAMTPEPPDEPFPGEHFRALSSNAQTCAIRTDGAMRCTGGPKPRSGKWKDVALGGDFVCALADTDMVECWSDPPIPDLEPPHVAFSKLSVDPADHRACGVDASGTVRCWGKPFRWMSWTYGPPPGAFVDVSVGASYACARAATSDAECWGVNQQGQINGQPPSLLYRN